MSMTTTTHVAKWANQEATASEEFAVWESTSAAPVLFTPSVELAALVTVAVPVATAATAAQLGVGGYVDEASLPSKGVTEGGSVSALLDAVA